MMLSVLLVLSGIVSIAVSGMPAALFSPERQTGQRWSVGLVIAGSLSGIAGTVFSLGFYVPPSLDLSWFIPWGQFAVTIDKLSAFFLFLVFTVPALGAWYSLGYWKQSDNRANGQRLSVFYGLLVGSMALVVIAHDAVLFLIAWEIMALSAFFALSAEDDKPEVRRAGWVYFVCTHMGTLILFAFFTLWRSASGSFTLSPASVLPAETAGLLFVLSVVGFGFKAGLVPFHVWLPGAHANAPSHVSAIMSGVMLKMGIYGILRMTGLLTMAEPWWGAVLLAAGTVTGLLGIAFAIGQRDFKRILAYSSIENIGIIVMGIGLALLGRSYGRADLILLGMGGALFHIWNHGLFKALLFFNSGAIIHATHTRDIESMGGLAKKMPVTAFVFFIGALSISALPPLNGFAGEWLLYLGLFKSLASSSNLAMAGFAAVGLATIGALAVATFVKMYSTVFLGASRSEATAHAHDPVLSMTIPMVILAGVCILFGIVPMLVMPFLESAVRDWAPAFDSAVSIGALAPQNWISGIGLALLSIVALFAIGRKFPLRKNKTAKGPTWDCGYTRPTSRMQYTGTSFAQPIVRLFSFVLFPATRRERDENHFPEKKRFDTAVPDTFLDRLFMPFFSFMGKLFPRVYIFQQGQTHFYVLYILVLVIALFIFGGTGVSL